MNPAETSTTDFDLNDASIKEFVTVSLKSIKTNTPIPSKVVDGKFFFHAEPDTAFKVEVTMNFLHPGFILSNRKYDHLLVGLTIDGNSVNYFTRVRNVSNNVASFIFDGYIQPNSENASSFNVLPFKFSRTLLADMLHDRLQRLQLSTVSENSVETEDQRGMIKVQFYDAEQVTERWSLSIPQPEVNSNNLIDEDQKLWKQPSTTVVCDEDHTMVQSINRLSFRWRRASETPCLEWTGYYHTPEIIELLQRIQIEGEEVVMRDKNVMARKNKRLFCRRDSYFPATARGCDQTMEFGKKSREIHHLKFINDLKLDGMDIYSEEGDFEIRLHKNGGKEESTMLVPSTPPSTPLPAAH